jgi:hypothetical protein
MLFEAVRAPNANIVVVTSFARATAAKPAR